MKSVAGLLLALFLSVQPLAAWANCTSSGTTVTCDTSPPNPYTITIGMGPATPSGTTVTLDANAQVVVGDVNAISLNNGATISVGAGSLVQNTGVSGLGLSGAGANTIEFDANNTLTIGAGGKVYSAGISSRAETINLLGSGNLIDNFGIIQADRAFPIYSESFGLNTIINEVGGVIQASSPTADVLGGFARVNFTNLGEIIGSLTLTGSNDQPHLFTGSSVTGSISGAGGTDALTLNGTGNGTLASAISNFETLTKQDAGTWTLAGSIGGGSLPLAVTIQGGMLELDGANTYAGGTTLNAGTLIVGNNSALGTGPLAMAAGTTLSFINTANFRLANNVSISGDPFFTVPTFKTETLSGVISDGSAPGTIEMQGPGTLVLSGVNTYTGATTISGGRLSLGLGGSIAASSGVNLTAAGATFDISGGGNQTIKDLSGVAGSSVNVGNNTLTFGTANSTTYGGIFLGGGGLVWQGTGTLTLTGADYGEFFGNMTINAGTVVLGPDASPDANLGGSVTVASGTLMGNGTIFGDLTNDGTVRPGGSIGTLTVLGNYTQSSSGTLTIEVSPTAASQLTIGGAANLAGQLALLYDPGVYTARSYTLLRAGSGVFGAFNSATGSVPTAGLNQEVLIGPTTVLLTLTAAPLPPLPDIPGVIEPGTPGAPADAIEIIVVEPTNDTIYSAVTTNAVLTAQQANGIILDRLGNRASGIADGQFAALGSAVAPVQYAQAGNGAVLGGLASALPQSLAAQGAWFRGIGGFASLNGNSTAPGFTGETGGFLAGYDRPVTPNLYLGVAGGYLHSNIDEHSTSSGTEGSARIALYGGMFAGRSLFTATAGYAHDWFDTQRGIADIGTAAESHAGNEATFAGQWSLPWQTAGLGGGIATLTPKAGFEFVHLSEGSFSETGASGFDLSSGGRGTSSLQPYVGLAASQKFVTVGGTEITPELRLGYAYEALNNSRLLTVTAVDGANFAVNGVKPSRSQLTGGLGVTIQAAPNLSFYATYDAIMPTGNTTDHAVQAGLHWRF